MNKLAFVEFYLEHLVMTKTSLAELCTSLLPYLKKENTNAILGLSY